MRIFCNVEEVCLLSAWDQIKELDDNWNSYGAEKPSQHSIENASKFVEWLHLNGMEENNVLASAEGGVGVCFYDGSIVEFLNDQSVTIFY